MVIRGGWLHDVWFDSVNVYDEVFSILKEELHISIVFNLNNAMWSGPFRSKFLILV